jgi:hypothetical protein
VYTELDLTGTWVKWKIQAVEKLTIGFKLLGAQRPRNGGYARHKSHPLYGVKGFDRSEPLFVHERLVVGNI